MPADARVCTLLASVLRVEQASLTGESEPVDRTPEPVEAEVPGCQREREREIRFCRKDC